jgi:hypothetical protein
MCDLAPDQIIRFAEAIEVRVNEAMWKFVPQDLVTKRGLAWRKMGGALAILASKSISLQKNRVLGFGADGGADEATLDEILTFYRGGKVKRFAVHLSPGPHLESVAGWLRRRGFSVHHHYSKLYRHTRDIPQAPTDLEVRRAGKSDAKSYFAIVKGVFAFSPDREEWIAATFGQPGFHHFLAFDGLHPVATGMLFVEGEHAWLGWGGTLTASRRQGAQSALIRTRLQCAAELGVKWVVSETLAPVPGRPQGSYRNLLRMGFKAAYLRQIWLNEER